VVDDKKRGSQPDPVETEFVDKGHDQIMATLEKGGGSRENAQALFAKQDAALDESADRSRTTDPRGVRAVDAAGRPVPQPFFTGAFAWGVVGGLALGALLVGLMLATGAIAPSSSGQRDAHAVRFRAYRACAMAKWQECSDLFDQAKASDPEGDADPGVQSARATATRGLKGSN
jgi:hypothetical protein